MVYLDKVRILEVLECQGVTRMFCQTVFYFLYVCHLDVYGNRNGLILNITVR